MRGKQLQDYKLKIVLSSQQKEILIGLLLGDAHLETQDNGLTYRLKYSQSVKRHEQYFLHIYTLFKDCILQKPFLRASPKRVMNTDKACVVNRSAQLVFSTISLSQFKFYGDLFYHTFSCLQKDKKKKIKVIPDRIDELLTEQSLAYWFMDDGSQKSKQSKGVLLNTQSFTKDEVEKLCVLLRNRFGLLASPRAQKAKNGTICFQIYISGKSYERLKQSIYPYIIPEMRYKFPSERKNKK